MQDRKLFFATCRGVRSDDLKAAGDYVGVHYEASLPAAFLRVHRSHIVNTSFVSALERDASGVGRRILPNGLDLPMSRRILPKVRSALTEAAE
jgi:hypothetical protein